MLSYRLKCRKNTKSKNSEFVETQKQKYNAFIKNLQCVTVKNQNLSKSKKLVDY